MRSELIRPDVLAVHAPVVHLTSIIPIDVYDDDLFAETFGASRILPKKDVLGIVVNAIAESITGDENTFNKHLQAAVFVSEFIRNYPDITHIYVNTEYWEPLVIPA